MTNVVIIYLVNEENMAKVHREPEPCRVCGNIEILTVEHILPRAAGGGSPAKIYKGDELLKTLNNSEDVPLYLNQQNGFVAHTLCKSCNNYSGKYYDKDFSSFYNIINYEVARLISGIKIEKSETIYDKLATSGVSIKLKGVKPFNIAKRILVMFCSVEHQGMTGENLEIRKAIQDKDYKPDVSGFSIYFTLHYGHEGYFATIAALRKGNNGKNIVEAYAGVELGLLGFYFSNKDEHKKGGSLSKTIDLTHWLTDYDYDEMVDIEMSANFEQTLGMKFKLPKSN